jgi:hypothetical protein
VTEEAERLTIPPPAYPLEPHPVKTTKHAIRSMSKTALPAWMDNACTGKQRRLESGFKDCIDVIDMKGLLGV